MFEEYTKINTVFQRDGRGRIVEGEYACPEFGYLADATWLFTEKVNGTNVRLSYDGADPVYRGNEHAFVAGRTNDAQLNPALLNEVVRIAKGAPFEDVFGDAQVTLYGEGYGPKIGPQGSRYADAARFILFDVRVGEWWLTRDNVIDVGAKLGLDVVAVVGEGTLRDAVELTREGFASVHAAPSTDNDDRPPLTAEGLVLRPMVDLWNRRGERVIAKIKHKDFRL